MRKISHEVRAEKSRGYGQAKVARIKANKSASARFATTNQPSRPERPASGHFLPPHKIWRCAVLVGRMSSRHEVSCARCRPPWVKSLVDSVARFHVRDDICKAKADRSTNFKVADSSLTHPSIDGSRRHTEKSSNLGFAQQALGKA